MIKQFVPQEICLKCQGCCRFSEKDSPWTPRLLDHEMQPLINSGLPPAMITLSKGLRVEPLSNGTIYICPLFNYAKNRCKVYSLRPLECQLYPFLINRRQETIFLAADLKCPFLEGKLDTPELKEYTLFLAGLLTSPPFAGVLRNNPQILQAYPDAVDLKEIKL